MDIGISTFLTDYSVDVATIAKRIEDLGFDSLWVPEHPIIPVTTESPWPGLAGRRHSQGVRRHRGPVRRPGASVRASPPP